MPHLQERVGAGVGLGKEDVVLAVAMVLEEKGLWKRVVLQIRREEGSDREPNKEEVKVQWLIVRGSEGE